MSLIHRGDSRALADLAWRAQLAVVLPYIDGVRRRYIERHGDTLGEMISKMHRCSADEAQMQVNDLEIAAVYHNLRSSIPSHEATFLRACYMARNSLAHGSTERCRNRVAAGMAAWQKT